MLCSRSCMRRRWTTSPQVPHARESKWFFVLLQDRCRRMLQRARAVLGPALSIGSSGCRFSIRQRCRCDTFGGCGDATEFPNEMCVREAHRVISIGALLCCANECAWVRHCQQPQLLLITLIVLRRGSSIISSPTTLPRLKSI